MENKPKLIILCGKSGTGKSTILDRLCEKANLHRIIATTTRPRRSYEEENAYHFINPMSFGDKIVSNQMIEWNTFNHWHYGTMLEDLSKDKINIGIFNPKSIKQIEDSRKVEIIHIFQIVTSQRERLRRSYCRGDDCGEILRRFFADEEDFGDIEEEQSWSYMACCLYEDKIYPGAHWMANEKENGVDNCVNIILESIENSLGNTD